MPKLKNQPQQRATEKINPAAASLDQLKTRDILALMNGEDQKVAAAVRKAIPRIAKAVDLAANALANGGRLIYIGAGTSGRLGVLDAVECLPTFSSKKVQAVLAGGRQAMFRSVEGAEDNSADARRGLKNIGLNKLDILVGLAASGRTPYTLSGLRYARQKGARTVAVTANPGSPMREVADVEIAINVGPEVVAGSSRLKAGTAQKLVLNMLSTATMVKMGRVFSGLMVHVQMKNAKLLERGRTILAQATGVDGKSANQILAASGFNLPAAILMAFKSISQKEALGILRQEPNTALVLRRARAEFLKNGSRRQHALTFRGKP